MQILRTAYIFWDLIRKQDKNYGFCCQFWFSEIRIMLWLVSAKNELTQEPWLQPLTEIRANQQLGTIAVVQTSTLARSPLLHLTNNFICLVDEGENLTIVIHCKKLFPTETQDSLVIRGGFAVLKTIILTKNSQISSYYLLKALFSLVICCDTAFKRSILRITRLGILRTTCTVVGT